MTIDQIAQLANQVNSEVRQKIPRSANRYLETDADESDWLKNPVEIQYTELLQTLVRTGMKGPGDTDLKQKQKVPFLHFFTKTISTDVSIRQLKQVLYDFLQNEKIDGKPINQPGLQARQAGRESLLNQIRCCPGGISQCSRPAQRQGQVHTRHGDAQSQEATYRQRPPGPSS